MIQYHLIIMHLNCSLVIQKMAIIFAISFGLY